MRKPVLFFGPLTGILLIAAVFHVAEAQIAPDLITFQGVLNDDSGDPVPDGSYTMTFKLYTAASGGSPVWTEIRTSTDAVQVTDGSFDVDLGEISSLSGVLFDQPLFLGIAVDADPEMSPRTPLASSPYAMSMRNIHTDGGEVIVAGPLGIGGAPTASRELTVNDTDGGGGSILNITATNRELVLGVNQSTGGLLRMLTNNNLNLGAGGADHMTIQSDGDVHVHEALSIGTSIRRAMLTVRGPNDPLDGPTMFMYGSSSDQTESGRIRFSEGTALSNWRGAFIHYDGNANALHIGTHNTSDDNVANDSNAITIGRSSRDVTVHEDLDVGGVIQKDYGGGSFSPAIPFAFGSVDASAEAFHSATASVHDLSKALDFWNIYLELSCTADSQVQSLVPVITVRETGVDDVSAFPDCCGNCPDCPGGGNCGRIIVKTNNLVGFQEVDFNFVVYDTE